MNFQVHVELPAEVVALHHGDSVLMLGSCFAEHVGRRVVDAGFRACVNPFGVLFNPESIRLALVALLDGLPADTYFTHDGQWHSWLHSTRFSASTAEGCRQLVEASYAPARNVMPTLDRLYVTWGTNHVYHLNVSPDGQERVVANCHKMPQHLFTEQTLSPSRIEELWVPLLARLFDMNARLQVVFTVSPYRYAKYGFHANQLNKASLFLAVDALCRRFEGRCHYFPAYEIVIDELRDYRFFEADMLHPSSQAVDYVWERFSAWSFDAATRQIIAEWEPLRRALAHKPFHPGSPEHLAFLQKIEQRVVRLKEKYPNFAPSYVPSCEQTDSGSGAR